MKRTIRVDFVYADGVGGEYPVKADVLVWRARAGLAAEVSELIAGPLGSEGQELYRLEAAVIERCEELAIAACEAHQ